MLSVLSQLSPLNRVLSISAMVKTMQGAGVNQAIQMAIPLGQKAGGDSKQGAGVKQGQKAGVTTRQGAGVKQNPAVAEHDKSDWFKIAGYVRQGPYVMELMVWKETFFFPEIDKASKKKQGKKTTAVKKQGKKTTAVKKQAKKSTADKEQGKKGKAVKSK